MHRCLQAPGNAPCCSWALGGSKRWALHGCRPDTEKEELDDEDISDIDTAAAWFVEDLKSNLPLVRMHLRKAEEA